VRHSRFFIGPEVNLTFFPIPQLMRLTKLLMAQGVIPRHDEAARTGRGVEVNDRKRTREDKLPGPSERHRYTAPTVKREEITATTRAQRIRNLQVSRGRALTVSLSVAPDGRAMAMTRLN
jgi:hypothetical protein